jgi:ribonucleoside-triphosphate reductase
MTKKISKGAQLLNRAIAHEDRQVIKRTGTKVRFDLDRITKAVAYAFLDVELGPDGAVKEGAPNHGLSDSTYAEVQKIATSASKMLELYYRDGKHPTIEQVQDAVEKSIAAAGHWEVACGYMRYRLAHAAKRLTAYEDAGLSDYIALSKYARYRPDLQRRELFAEAAARVRDMHHQFFQDRLDRKFADKLPSEVKELADGQAELLLSTLGGSTLRAAITDAFAQVEAKRVLPSMRSLQFGGAAILSSNSRMFNCSFSLVDRLAFFREYFFLLLSGCGVGFSVQRQHVAYLPTFPRRLPDHELEVRHHHVEDTIEGWANALDALFQAFLDNKHIEFDYSGIRPAGAPLVTSGGKAPGHMALKVALNHVYRILSGASGRQLRTIEVYDICMFVAKAVLSGGIRRSATICLFSPDDEEMMAAKTGDWFSTNPQRSASNNSAVLNRKASNEQFFRKLFEMQKEFGEPGFFFQDDPDSGTNPCVEIGLKPIIDWKLSPEEDAKLRAWCPELAHKALSGIRLTGWQMCNLTTINGTAATTERAFYKACIYAAFIGTLQAAYTNMPYIGGITRVINDHDALLGVSICGFMDSPQVLFDESVLTIGAGLVRATNKLVAELIGINPAARTSCVKPEGTASLLLGASSGIHPHHAEHYFRRVQANKKEPVYQHFKARNPQMTEPSVYDASGNTDVITFPVIAPKKAILRKTINAIQFLELVRLVQQAWVIPGTDPKSRNPDITHNVSNTCTVTEKEWADVADFIWAQRKFFTGISLLKDTGDTAYAQAPRQEVVTDADILRWNGLQPNRVDYTQMRETSDVTNLKEVVACAGGACELP